MTTLLQRQRLNNNFRKLLLHTFCVLMNKTRNHTRLRCLPSAMCTFIPSTEIYIRLFQFSLNNNGDPECAYIMLMYNKCLAYVVYVIWISGCQIGVTTISLRYLFCALIHIYQSTVFFYYYPLVQTEYQTIIVLFAHQELFKLK